ncbi:hypothetical protein KFL_004330100 [Klebsormidium nitens]|uniref:Rieske domain-containing protein n=1 Tax=Klebsormidium nitens TaxID=105231 RepID=A0A1Y1ID21_KLENI|nr:hypothetical protein KFL_004330100 [Klebsormidium nitens]|eukprot:GAQ88493.1 hypothetical protein KFL_004330100 [Klebsormidium nitens]
MAEEVRVPSAQIPRRGRSVVVQLTLQGAREAVGAEAGVSSTQDVVVFNTGEGFYAVENSCPHKGWPLAGGSLEGCELRCPWHGWCVDLKTGEVTDMEDICCSRACTIFRRPKGISTFGVRKEGDSLVVTKNERTTN